MIAIASRRAHGNSYNIMGKMIILSIDDTGDVTAFTLARAGWNERESPGGRFTEEVTKWNIEDWAERGCR
jgi:hypothetical protein